MGHQTNYVFVEITDTYHEYILLTKITAAQNEVAHIYYKVCGLYFMAVIFAATLYRSASANSAVIYVTAARVSLTVRQRTQVSSLRCYYSLSKLNKVNNGAFSFPFCC